MSEAETAHIVVTDDEKDVRETVQEYLNLQGLKASAADSGAALRRIMAEQPVDLVLLDVRMPGEDGLTIARHLRATSTTGIIMLTAAGEVVDRVVGLEMGADDYIPKPVDLRELLARVKAVLRRLRLSHAAETEEDKEGSIVAFGANRLNLDSQKLFNADGEEVAITSMEFDLLKVFSEHPNRVLTRDHLLNLSHQRGWEHFDRSIDIRVSRLRKKIEADPTKPQVIKTVHGKGYMFAPRPG
jgi:DNA-binding response OmpR family regulator